MARGASEPNAARERFDRTVGWTGATVAAVAPSLLTSARDLPVRLDHSRYVLRSDAHREVTAYVGARAVALSRVLAHRRRVHARDAPRGRHGSRSTESVPGFPEVHGAEHLLRRGGSGDRDATLGGDV